MYWERSFDRKPVKIFIRNSSNALQIQSVCRISFLAGRHIATKKSIHFILPIHFLFQPVIWLNLKIMKAYTGKKDIQEKSVFREKRALVTKKRSLDAYGRSSKYYGKSFRGFRIGFWICAIVLTSGLAIWAMIYLIRKGSCRLRTQEGNTGEKNLFAGLLKWIAAIGGLICSVYLYVSLVTDLLDLCICDAKKQNQKRFWCPSFPSACVKVRKISYSRK